MAELGRPDTNATTRTWSHDEYEFHGGFFDVSPVVLDVPYDHRWYLVVDSCPQRITVEVTQVFD